MIKKYKSKTIALTMLRAPVISISTFLIFIYCCEYFESTE